MPPQTNLGLAIRIASAVSLQPPEECVSMIGTNNAVPVSLPTGSSRAVAQLFHPVNLNKVVRRERRRALETFRVINSTIDLPWTVDFETSAFVYPVSALARDEVFALYLK